MFLHIYSDSLFGDARLGLIMINQISLLPL